MPRVFQKRSLHRIRRRLPIPILQLVNQCPRPRILRLHVLAGGIKLLRQEFIRPAHNVVLNGVCIGRPQILPRSQQLINPVRPVRPGPAIADEIFISRPNSPRIRRSNDPASRIERLRQFVEGNVSRPLKIIRIPGHREIPIPRLANRNPRRHHVTNISLDVRINSILPRPGNLAHHLQKLIPILRAANQRIRKIQSSRLHSRPPQRISPPAFFSRIATHDRPMPRQNHIQRLIRLSPHVNHFPPRLRLHPFPIHSVLQRIRRIERLDVKVLHFRIAVRKSPGNPVVMPNHHQRRPRKSKSRHIPTRRSQMHDVPNPRNAERKMRIISQNRFPGSRMLAAHNKIIATNNLPSLRFEL